MTSPRLRFAARHFAALALVFAAACSSGDNSVTLPPPPVPALTTINVTFPAASIMIGQTTTAAAAGLDQNGASFATGTVTWSSAATNVATVTAAGVITGVAAGTAQITATAGGKSGQASVTVTAPPAVIFNEVESNGGTPGDWAELYNPTTTPVNLAGWVFKDNDDTHIYTIPANTTIAAGGYLVLEEAQFGFGLGAPESVRLFSPFGTIVAQYDWTAHATVTYGRCPNITGAFGNNTTPTKGATNDCSVPVKINEVESSGGTPGDWIELYNPSNAAVSLAGFVVKDDDDTHSYAIPAGTTIAAGGYYVVEEASLGFGLGAPDAARLFTPTGAVVDSYSWTAHAGTTYGRCPDATGAFALTAASTKGTSNSCVGAPTAAAWPGSDDVTTVDGTSVFGGNMSGLTYEGANGAAPAVLWAVRNGPGTLFRLLFNGTIWTPDGNNNWQAGKPLRYPDGTGDPDAEGVTFAAAGGNGGIYVATERNNASNAVSRNSILRFDPTQPGATLTATNDWNITSDLPVVGANLGIEAITWIPDAFLVSKGFFDQAANRTYAPADYPDHGTGLYFVGVEANGLIYAYALNHSDNTFRRIATITTGFPGVMGLEFDRELGYLWAVCDDGCTGRSAILEIDSRAAATTFGRFLVSKLFERPSTMLNLNNEGFAFAPQSECVNGRKAAFWSDDSETGGHAIRRAGIPCIAFP